MENKAVLRQRAISLLHDVFGDKYGKIINIKDIHSGYTNISFVATFENHKTYQVRLPHEEVQLLLNRRNEYAILKYLGLHNRFDYFDKETGAAIKQWIPGKCPRIHKWMRWKHTDQLFRMIKKIHETKVPSHFKLGHINLDAYNANLHRFNLAIQAKFLSIIDTYRDDKMVLNHTDINAKNIILSKSGRLHLIDFEWCGYASDYWDYANFIRESRIAYSRIKWDKYIKDFNMDKLRDYIFASAVYAYLWTWMMPETKKILKYRRQTYRQARFYGWRIIHNGNNK